MLCNILCLLAEEKLSFFFFFSFFFVPTIYLKPPSQTRRWCQIKMKDRWSILSLLSDIFKRKTFVVSYLNKKYINVHTKSERLASKINGTFWHLGKWRGFFLKSQSPPGILRMRTNVAFTSPFAQYIFQSFTPYLVNVHLFCALIRTILKDFKTFLAFRQQPLNNQSKK